ncbi:MAG: insulinase family protein, partial [Lewinellaceae bacterium]|nr:insulinase family protein [Lewinellaceae bacterium]
MRFIKLILVLFVLAGVTQLPAQEDFRKTAPKPGPAPKIQLSAYEQFSLPNGLQVIVVENHKLPRVSFQVFVDVPETLEGDYAGVSSMAGQLLTTGTKTRSKAQIDEAIDFIGASLSGNAKGMFGTALSKHRDQLLELMSDVLFNATFPQEEFDKLKKQTLSGLASQKDDPNAISNNVSSVLLYGKNHPYGELTTEATVSRIGVDQCKEYVRNNFKPNIAYLIIVGDITVADAKKVANTYFGKWVKGDVKKPKLTQPQAPAATQVSFVDKTGAVQSLIDITYPIDFKPGNPENTAASVMNKILGGGSSGRLFKNIREDKGYTYGAYSSISSDELIGNFSASASVRNAVTDSSLVEFMAELNRMRNEPVTAEELAFAKAE